VSECHTQSERDRAEDGVLNQRWSSHLRPLPSSACFRSSGRRGGNVRTSLWDAANNCRSYGRHFIEHTLYLYPWSQKTRTCSNLRFSRIPCGNLESARCRLRRHSSQHQQRWRVAPWAAITVPVSPSNRMDVHEWHPAGHPAPESTICLQATNGVMHPFAKKYRALNDRVARAVGSYGRAKMLVYLRSIAWAYLSRA